MGSQAARGFQSSAHSGVSARASSSTNAPTPSTATAPSDSQRVATFYHQLAGFIDARQLGEIQRLRSDMSVAEENRWRRLFKDSKVSSVRASFAVLDAQEIGGTIYAHLIYDLGVTRKGKLDDRKAQLRVQLSRETDSLRETKWEETKYVFCETFLHLA